MDDYKNYLAEAFETELERKIHRLAFGSIGKNELVMAFRETLVVAASIASLRTGGDETFAIMCATNIVEYLQNEKSGISHVLRYS